ncbi:YqaE/Pmp3 family membrane protein [Marivirga salinae]|uniref:YqaE/Pmp3 family membrane protein n=1 Tax=Marivirga salinarum TaxID=3059078 RepID=A0AA49JH04_9BACT|nr:YqaE/Pmp3 family membrane protein [Marivirga sp. BDSF4-3]WKK77319.2 YqaE/Pmp3 family membrane protein [Marivirga sp. BDSF4-3]
MSVIQIILAIFLPPVAVAMGKGLTSAFWINLILTILFFIPGVIHAFYVLTK